MSKLPTEPGFYWARDRDDKRQSWGVVYITRDRFVMAEWHAYEVGSPDEVPLDSYAEIVGPLVGPVPTTGRLDVHPKSRVFSPT